MKPVLRSYQQTHVEKLAAIMRLRKVAHDGSDAGTGKTYCAAAIAAELNLSPLVICPLSVVPSWEKVLGNFGIQATVINYESAWRQLGMKVKCGRGFYFVFKQNYPLVIYDECHRTGGETTINSKMLIASRRAGSHILTLSATAADSVMKLKALGFALGLHQMSDYHDWLIGHGVVERPIYRKGGQQVFQKDGRPAIKLEIGRRANTVAMQKLHQDIFGIGSRGSRMCIADIPDFPETQIEIRVLSDAPKEVLKLSDELQTYIKQRNALGKYSDEVLAKLVFWRQSAEIAKIPHFMDAIEDALETSKVALFVNFNRTIDEILDVAKKRKWTTGFIRGEQPAEERQAFIEAFQRNEIDLIVCNIQAGGVGVSLHDPVSKYPRTALFSPPWSAKDLKQGFGRVHRDGGGKSRQFLMYWGRGVEAKVAASVQRKLDNLSLLNDAELDGSFCDPVENAEQPTLKL